MAGQKLIPYVHPVDNQQWDHFFVDEKSLVIYFEKKHNGKRIKFSCKEKYPEGGVRAKRFANAEFDRRIGKKKNPHVKNLVKEELELWLKVKEKESLAYDTMNNIRRAKRQIEEFWGDFLPHEITLDNASLWYDDWKLKHPDISIENAVKYMNNFCGYLAQKQVNGVPLLPAVPLFADPDRKETLIKREVKKNRILTEDEFKKILETAESLEHEILVLFMYTMATRIDETLKMRFGVHIILEAEIPVYRWFMGSNKADLAGQHALHLLLIPRLEMLYKIRLAEGNDLLFPQKFKKTQPAREQHIDWDKWRERANLGWHWTSHIFRHTCLSLLFNNAANPQATICKQYRVSLSVALDTYIKTTTEAMLQMRDAIKLDLSEKSPSKDTDGGKNK